MLKRNWIVTTFLLIYFVLSAYWVVTRPSYFYDWDESIYMQVGKEMVREKTLIPLWQGEYWPDKPPLIPFLYGLISQIQPAEISTRIFTLSMAVTALGLLYVLYKRVVNDQLLATLIVMLTTFTPIFQQRSQVVNTDIFLLIGWVGYLLFFKRFYTSLFFLFIAFMSKSLLGFYPVGIFALFYGYQFITKKIKKAELLQVLKKMTMQVLILSVWYVIMYILYGNDFLHQHIYEHHFRRVTSSIEFHFGEKTFYFNVIYQQYGKYIFVSLIGLAMILYQYFKRQLDDKMLLYALYLLPWFIFLNLTKTKIFWYIHPAVAQFSFLILYPVTLLKTKKIIYYGVCTVLFLLISYQYFIKQPFYIAQYTSNNDPHYKLAFTAKEQCTDLTVLIEPQTRQDIKTLEEMNLLITTSTWWGDHPSMVYYMDKPIEFIYDKEQIPYTIKNSQSNSCLSIDKKDLDLAIENQNYQKIGEFGEKILFKKQEIR